MWQRMTRPIKWSPLEYAIAGCRRHRRWQSSILWHRFLRGRIACMWNVCVRHLNQATATRPPPHDSHGLILLCLQIPISALVSFVEALEVGYSKHKNPYHNLMHAADVTQTVHYLLLKTGMVVSRPSQRQPSCWQSAGPRWAHRHRFVLVWTHRVLIQVNFIHATPWMWLTAAAGLIAALPDMQLLFLLGRHMSNSLSKKKKKTRFRWSFY